AELPITLATWSPMCVRITQMKSKRTSPDTAILGDMRALFLEYLREPNLESYLAVRKAVIAHPSYQPYSEDLEDLDEMIDAEDYQAVLDLMPHMLPNLMLSPRLHLMLGYVHRRMGDEESAEMESAVARACIEGILMTGRGTENEPWLV